MGQVICRPGVSLIVQGARRLLRRGQTRLREGGPGRLGAQNTAFSLVAPPYLLSTDCVPGPDSGLAGTCTSPPSCGSCHRGEAGVKNCVVRLCWAWHSNSSSMRGTHSGRGSKLLGPRRQDFVQRLGPGRAPPPLAPSPSSPSASKPRRAHSSGSSGS